MVEFIQGDNRDVLRKLIVEGRRVHSVVTDPPYYLESIVKRFGKESSAPAKFGTDGAFARASRGFMGKSWDGADENGERIAQDPEFWKLVYELLLPGGYVLAFSSPRTGHWQACAMETAGFVMHPFFGWAYAQGMPKAPSVSKLIDKAAGNERKVVGTVKRRDIRNGQREARGANLASSAMRQDGPKYIEHAITEAGSPEAAEWEGWYYGTQSCKPALEPIYFAQRPFDQSSGFKNVLVHGVGAVNIEACRVPGEGVGVGRWPANLLHDNSDEVCAVFPDSDGQQARAKIGGAKKGNIYGKFAANITTNPEPRNDGGSAARFFNSFPPDGSPIGYFGKAGKVDRAGSEHPTVKPIALMRWLCRLVTPPGGTVLDPFAGSGSTGQAAIEEGFKPILIERDPSYADDIRWRFGLGTPRSIDILDLLGVAEDVDTLLGAPSELEELLG